jgi:ATP-dependent Lon protease
MIPKDNKKSAKITKKLINTWLGHEIYDYGTKEKKNQIGVVTGLAYTSFGGDILPVEVNYFEGKGNLIVTGQLGDVMQESTKIALDFIKANAKKYNIPISFFETHDIHIHVPEGAVPKDGPSAGVTITTAIVSALTNRPVKKDLAMTGEVTLRGNVLPIGGLKEKSLAAHRSGITTIIIPKGNIKDLDEIPDTVKENIQYIPVEKVDQVINEAIISD